MSFSPLLLLHIWAAIMGLLFGYTALLFSQRLPPTAMVRKHNSSIYADYVRKRRVFIAASLNRTWAMFSAAF